MSDVLRVLQVEDSESDAALIVRLLEKGGYEVQAERVEDAAAMRAALAGKTWDAIIADYRLPQWDARAALEVLRQSGLDLPFLVVSGTIGEDVAVAMMKAGAHDYIMKDHLARLAPAVKREIQDAQVRRERQRAEQELRSALAATEERQRLLDAVFSAQTEGVFVCDASGSVIRTNPAAAAFFGADPTGMHIAEVVEKFQIAPGIESCATCRAMGGETVVGAEHTAGGRAVETSAAPIRDHAGALAGAVTICRDITERKRHEADREAMVALLPLLNSPNDTRELIRTVTALLQEWSGCAAAGVRLRDGDDYPFFETRGLTAEFVEAENHLCSRTADREPSRDGQGIPVLECLCGDILSERIGPRLPYFSPGGSFWSNDIAKLVAERPEMGRPGPTRNRCFAGEFQSLALIPLRSTGGTLGLLQFGDKRPDRLTPEGIARMERAAASLAIALEQRRTQEALRASEERYRLISENTADIIWLLNADSGRLTFVSPSVKHVLGYSPEEAMAGGLWLTLTPESSELAERRLAEARAAHQRDESVPTLVQQVDQVRKDGAIVHTEVATTLLPHRPGRACEILGVTRDVTDRVQVEARLMQAQKLESVGRLAGGVAHDFNNLLTVINGYSDMLLRELPPGDRARESVAEIATAGERAAALTAQLLMLSRKQVVQPKVVNLNDAIMEVQKMLARVIGEDIRLQSVLSPDPGCVRADPGQLHQVLMNLAVNARDAMPRGGTLLIETGNVQLQGESAEHHPDLKPGPYVQLEVSDTGTGMTKEVVSHVFEPFFTTKKAGEGTGLGLATVYGIVKQCGGSIWVYSEPGLGTRFRIHLPRIESEGAKVEEPQLDAPALRGTETILVVEDQEQLRRMVAQALRSRGYTVLEAANAGEALARAEQDAGAIHLLLTDMVMPGLSGGELAGRLKALRPDMAILFMSGYSERAAFDRQALGGAYLAKPFSAAELAVKVREVLGSRGR
jgi:PAS domain S-box-containing protein